MNRIIIKFHLRRIARETKMLVKHVLGIPNPHDLDISQSTAAWHQPRVGHPSELCICPDRDARPEDHVQGCPWAERMCTACKGDGYCGHCGGDAIEPGSPPYDIED